MNKKTYQIFYEFHFSSDHIERFDVQLDSRTCELLSPIPSSPPSWTRMSTHQCGCCSLEKKTTPYCPVAVNISSLVNSFKNIISVKKCVVRCKTPERTYLKKTSTMEGLSSVLGVIMATSNCPVMVPFRPMARFHLPFSTIEETIVRSVSMYLLRQYFEQQSGRPPDMNLVGLQEHYDKVRLLNEGLLKRISDLSLKKDSDKNALLIFHSLSQLLAMESYTSLKSIAYLFSGQGDI